MAATPRIPNDIIRERFADGRDDVAIGEGYSGADEHYVFRRRMVLGLHRKRGSKKGGRKQKNMRHGSHRVNAPANMPAVDNRAFTEKRTLFPSKVYDVSEVPRVLIEGKNSRKIGGKITKGWFAGYPIYTLTLHERATCPESCQHWRSCYGNSMHHARRIQHGPAFEHALAVEIALMAIRHPGGFAIRLHVLGDFYSESYVDFWRRMLHEHQKLFVFGFTARWDADNDPIALKLLYLVHEKWHRFAVRFSNAPVDECATVSIEHPLQKPADAIICPAQLGKTESCGTCGLCWHSRRRIAFLQH